MLIEFFLPLLLDAGPLPAVPTHTPGFNQLSRRPSDAEVLCDNPMQVEWTVSSAGRPLAVSAHRPTETVDALPFGYPPDRDRRGERHVVEVDDGWLVGFDAGEFGGGLWWFSRGGERYRRVSPPERVVDGPDARYLPENVRGLARRGDDVLVFMGLDHLQPGPGRIFRAHKATAGWALELVARLDSCPRAWLVDGERVHVVTGGGLWSVGPAAGPRKLHALDAQVFSPDSMMRGPDGALFVGMRRYVVRLQPRTSGWEETWFVWSGPCRGD